MEFNSDFQFEDASRQCSHPWDFKGALSKAEIDPALTTVDEKIQNKLARKKALTRRPQRQESDEDESDDGLPGEVDDGDDELEESESDDDDFDDAGEGEDAPSEHSDEDDGAAQLNSLLQELRSERQQKENKNNQKNVPASSKRTEDVQDTADDSEASASDAEPEQDRDEDKHSSDEEDDKDTSESSDEDELAEKQPKKKQLTKANPTADAAAPEGEKPFFSSTPKSTKFKAQTFASLGLSRPLLKAVSELSYPSPTPIQAAVVPLALAGRDIVASAITGSGKTAAFALPLLERLLFRTRSVAATHVLVLCPTRELAAQVHSMICQLAKHTDIRAALIIGGLSLSQQATELRQAPEIVVATPGRIIDHVMNTMAFELDSLSALVLDEADRLLEMGFQDELKQILKLTPTKRQTLLFSATMTSGVQQLIQLSLTRPVRLAADATSATPKTLRQEVVRLKGGVAAADKACVLCALCARALKGLRCIVFCRQKRHAHWLKVLLGLAEVAVASELHGDMTQAARLQALESFRTGDTQILLATDVAARGLDILGVQAVVNYDCPKTLATYLHRVGRTARAGAKGLSISLVEDQDRSLMKEVVKHANSRLEKRELPNRVIKSWREKVEGLARSVEDVLMEEKQEKAFRQAEMEAAKAGNIIEHEAEIYARPKREWFQTQKQKQASAKAAAENEQGNAVASAVAVPKSKRKNAQKGAIADQKGEDQVKPQKEHPHMSGTKHIIGGVKAAKAAARGFRESGAKPREAAKAALTATGASKREKQKNKRKREDNANNTDSEGVPGLKMARNSRVYAGGGKSGSVKLQKTGASKVERARMQRGGKGKGQFKGKARYKRK